jgi:NTE family protein
MTEPYQAPTAAACSELVKSYDRVALVLQGGGALGAYQAGVYEALAEHGILPTWVAGVSIGAINAALIAGNPPERRAAALEQFWHTVAPPFAWGPLEGLFRHFTLDGTGVANQLSALKTIATGQPGFFRPRVPPPWVSPTGPTSLVSYYDTSPLRSTLERLVDFDRINAGEIRVGLGAVNIKTGNYIYFDNTKQKIGPEHVMASGALPPGFAAVEVDGEFYWDGGLVSNTPLYHVLEDHPRRNTLVFQVDLWSARGDLPTSMPMVMERQKDIVYSSRTRFNTDAIQLEQRMRSHLAALLDHLPPDLRDTPEATALRYVAHPAFINVLHLIYRHKRFETDSKDYEFSHETMRSHWQVGREDTIATLEHREWLAMPPDASGMVTHDLERDAKDAAART